MPSTPFHDLDDFVALPRTTALELSPGGDRLVALVSVLSPDRKRYVTSLWDFDVEGQRAARRLTRSDKGETQAAFLPDGSLLFVSARPDPDATEQDEDEPTALWLLPPGGGEPRRVLSRGGGFGDVGVARDAGTVVGAADVLLGAGQANGADDAELRRQRKDRGVSAVLHTGFPVRSWDHDLGAGAPHLLVATPPDGEEPWPAPRDLTPDAGRALDDQSFAVTPDGTAVVTSWAVGDRPGSLREQLRVVDVASGEQRMLLDDAAYDFNHPTVSPDGRWVACERVRRPTYEAPDAVTVVVVPLAGGDMREVFADLDLWTLAPAWAPDSTALYVTADEGGRGRVFRGDLESGKVVRLTGDDAAYDSVRPSPDGRYLYALRAAVDEPQTPVRLDTDATDQEPVRLRGPLERLALPGTLTEVETAAEDGRALRGWLVLPDGASAERSAPLLVWVHGGPMTSWNTWHWRWSPWVMAARGYAVLLPDPALSTGYGEEFIRRGWGSWGDRPYIDVLALTDAALERPDVDAERTAAMGGSFGGYMANWVATQTGRFRAVVTHASLWALDQFGATTDVPSYWFDQFGDPAERPERYDRWSPHRFADQIATPMLVIHGDRDYRVPVGEGLRLYWDLVRRGVDAQFLYFPDENHWVLKPGNVVAWYETVCAFLDHHVLGEQWRRPPGL